MSVNPLHKVKEFFIKRNHKEVWKVEQETLSREDEAICELLKQESTPPVICPSKEVIDRIMTVRPIEQPIFIHRG
jgi:hypothetical protein